MNSIDSGIYSITSKTNGKRYIGSAIRICKRWNEHLNELRLNKHHSEYLQRHYNKYGKDDLIFTVLEVINREDITLEECKQLLIKREQIYLDNWNECEFNASKIAGSTLGYKKAGSKYYYYNKRDNTYQTFYNVEGKGVRFTPHLTETEAIKEVEYIKSLTEQELIEYKKECLARPARKPISIKRQINRKNYSFNKLTNKWIIRFNINNKRTYFGTCLTEIEAIERVKHIKLELGI